MLPPLFVLLLASYLFTDVLKPHRQELTHNRCRLNFADILEQALTCYIDCETGFH